MSNKRDESSVQDVKHLMRDHYLRYASYVILDRAIPKVDDGLKPVQRRILQTLFRMHDQKFHKVANVAGQAMAFHPHGEAPIYEALVHLANRGFLLDTQGNFGNLYTGDPAAAARYIETRLSPLAYEALFNPSLTDFIPSYDGRNVEPVTLPSKIPLLLMQGAEGIAVGMSTKIFPHNFKELLEAEIAILENRPFALYPDFPTGGIMDASEYNKGKGKVRLRAKIEIKDPKTLVVREICYGTTTESVIHSIDEAAKRGKLKIDSIHDYTSERVEIEIKLPRGVYAEELIDLLYAYTECQVNLTSQMIVIKDNLPCEMDVEEILRYNVELLLKYLQKELELELKGLQDTIYQKTLEQIFIENRLYKHIEEVAEFEEVYPVLTKSFKPYLPELDRVPEKEDFDRLLAIPIRRIARFDIEKNQQDIKACEKKASKVKQHLKTLNEYAISYVKSLITQYASQFPRKTKLQEIEVIDKKAIETKEISVGFDPKNAFIGTKVQGSHHIECTNFDKLLLFYKSGSYKVINIPEKLYVGVDKDDLVHVGVADKKSVFSVCYKDPKSGLSYIKRFIIKQFILDKVYHYFEENMKLLFMTTAPEAKLLLHLMPKPRQKISAMEFIVSTVAVKNVTAKGIRMSPRPIMKLEEIKSRDPSVSKEEECTLKSK